jgi:hypothetical protein
MASPAGPPAVAAGAALAEGADADAGVSAKAEMLAAVNAVADMRTSDIDIIFFMAIPLFKRIRRFSLVHLLL